ncbi:capsid cement protein [Nocardia jinanensis]|uniref:DUF2190 domain-containing protein n=1 Tax=Nocardia jinanensis TaxID=382504 RepID=A0A917RIP1_9NOCA|nr:capsid cement protein [Nocardia jinanensis]GGL09690.1 hypothetical protein GCM10011588_25090 [Nocardia jinanensis]
MPDLSIDVYDGRDVTARASAAIAASTFVAISGARSAGLLTVATATAGGRTAGVAKYDAASGELVGLARGNARILRIVAGANLTAGAEVEVGTAGKAIPKASGVAVGYAVDTATTGALAAISLY